MPISARISLLIAASAGIVLFLSVYAFTEMNTKRGLLGDYKGRRSVIVHEEAMRSLGGTLELSPIEAEANEVLMEFKRRELEEGFANSSAFNPAHHFFHRRKSIEESDVFKTIKLMPKGGVLHAHDTALIGGDFLIKNVTYLPNLYICSSDDAIHLKFFRSPPADDPCSWQLLADVRQKSGQPEEFDRILAKRLTLTVKNPDEKYPDIDAAWENFMRAFDTVTPMLTYKPVWEMYFYEALRQYREDGIFYLEFRSTLPDLYDLDGNSYGPEECARSYKKVSDEFASDHPDFFGARLIYAPLRFVSERGVAEYVATAVKLKEELGDFLAGFDLVGQEEKGPPLVNLVDEISELPDDIDVFYHCGETNWFGSETDFNLIDAVLLGAKRLGHAYALLKHPVIARTVREKDIAIEVNPISNQVLKLVRDMRNHPAAILLADGYPVVISSDDPGLWGALPMSHDLYMAFVGMASARADIRMLKQLALNTIKYSSMPDGQKAEAYRRYAELWQRFVEDLAHAARRTSPTKRRKPKRPKPFN